MISAMTNSARLAAWLVAALSAVTMSSAAFAYTPEQEQACTGDAFRICSSEIPDVDRVTVCMIRNKAQLSPPCRAFFRPDPAPMATPVTTRRPLSLKPARAAKPVTVTSRKIKPSAKRVSRN